MVLPKVQRTLLRSFKANSRFRITTRKIPVQAIPETTECRRPRAIILSFWIRIVSFLNNISRRVNKELNQAFVHCFGGPDAADSSFTDVQKALNYVMTSFFTSGGIRGGEKSVGKFQPRSFNMGISKEAFEKAGGFGRIHPGEDPDLTFRIWKAGFDTRLFPKAFVYHKRRIDWNKFYIQVNKFGMVRPILNKWHPGTARPTYWFPTFFMLGLGISILLAVVGFLLPLWLYVAYFLVLFLDAWLKNRNVKVAFLAIFAALTQLQDME